VLEEMKLTTYDQLQILAQVAVDYPESLQQLRQVHYQGYISHSLLHAWDQSESNLLRTMYCKVKKSPLCDIDFLLQFLFFQCFYELVSNCHKLEKIIICVRGKGPKLAYENHYLPAIKAIKPDVFDFFY
jgi:hypothetical protein